MKQRRRPRKACARRPDEIIDEVLAKVGTILEKGRRVSGKRNSALPAKIVNLPAGEARLTAAGDFFDANTIYFGSKPAVGHVCANRAEAELLYAIAREGLRGPVSLPATERECLRLTRVLESRLTEARLKFDELAQVRAGTDKLREQVIDLLYRWFIHGRPA